MGRADGLLKEKRYMWCETYRSRRVHHPRFFRGFLSVGKGQCAVANNYNDAVSLAKRRTSGLQSVPVWYCHVAVLVSDSEFEA